jgi:hypothetical protein
VWVCVRACVSEWVARVVCACVCVERERQTVMCRARERQTVMGSGLGFWSECAACGEHPRTQNRILGGEGE